MKIIFPIKVYQKFRSYIENCDEEISGLGKISKKDDIITIEDVKIFPQTTSRAETTMDKKALGKFYDEIVQKGEQLLDWKLWWHSHAKMDTFFSSTDIETIADFDNDLKDDNWMLSIVSNHAADLLARLDIYQPIRCTMNKLDWEIDFKDEQIEQDAILEIIQKVNNKVIIIPPHVDVSKFFKHPPYKPTMKMLDGKMVVINPDTGLPF